MSFPRYPEYKDSGVEWLGEVPAHWDVVKLKRLCFMQSGEFISPSDIEDEGAYPVYGGNGRRGYTTSYTHSGFYPVIGRQGALCGNINYANGQFWASEHAVVASPETGTSPIWLGELLRAMDLNQYSITAAQPGLAVDKVKNLHTPQPPLNEQQTIAAFLDYETSRIDALIEEQQRLIELLKEKRQAVISHAVTKGLDSDVPMKNSGLEWLGAVPSHWRIVPVRSLAKQGLDGFTDGDWIETPFITDEGIRLIQTGNIAIGRFKEQGYRYISEETFRSLNCTEFYPGDVLICRLAEPVGRACLAPALGSRMVTSVDVCILKCRENIDSRYIVHFLSGLGYLSFMESVARGGTRQRVSRSFLGNVRIALPPLNEQSRIADFLEAKLRETDQLHREANLGIKLLRERRAALISAAVTGKIDVRNWRAPAEPETETFSIAADSEAAYEVSPS